MNRKLGAANPPSIVSAACKAPRPASGASHESTVCTSTMKSTATPRSQSSQSFL